MLFIRFMAVIICISYLRVYIRSLKRYKKFNEEYDKFDIEHYGVKTR